ncbi:hypothetical protein B0H15DRAFT_947716 [Mycena belliarum]|uniref:Uncharacterized protein n=1 Tax=Mycena belliarum TaxID=1033014 RepID=A0AAD6U6M0_9AGAR|nr:hypothetical protein B0H15DRAFT_947716 [Mycena belliae]
MTPFQGSRLCPQSSNTSSTLVGFGRTQRNEQQHILPILRRDASLSRARQQQAGEQVLASRPGTVSAYPASAHNCRASLSLGSLRTVPRPFLSRTASWAPRAQGLRSAPQSGPFDSGKCAV